MLLINLDTWWSGLDGVEQVFWSIALIATPIFVIQTLVSLFGMDADSSFDVDHPDPGSEFSLLSVRAILIFFSFFGWAGLLLLEITGLVWLATGAGILAGYSAAFAAGYAINAMARLTQIGTTDTGLAVNQIGQVYLVVPGKRNGYGKVHVHLRGALKEMDAITDGDTIDTGTRVRIVEVIGDNVLIVTKEN